MSDTLHLNRIPRRILVVCTQRIGDVLLATPLVRSLKRAWPQAQVDFLAFKGTEGVLEGNPDIAEVITVPARSPWKVRLGEYRRLWNRYDLAAATIPSDRCRSYTFAAARQRVGFLTGEAKDRSKAVLLNAHAAFDDQMTHTVAMGDRLSSLLGIPASLEVVPPGQSSGKLESTLAQLSPLAGRPFAVLHPFPKFPYKMWREEAWVALGNKLAADGLALVLTGGPDPEEVAYCGRVASGLEGALDLSGRLGLGATAEILRRATLYVGPDTAVTHIAAACGIPVVALFGPSNPVKWGPWPADWRKPISPWLRQGSGRRGNVHLLQGEGDCVPCLLEGCDRHVGSLSRCLQEMSVERVYAAAKDMLVGA